MSDGLPAHLHTRETTLVFVFRAPLAKIETYTSCFLRDGDSVFHTYSMYARGAETLGGSYYYLDLTALGRQKDWEEPKGRATDVRGAIPDFSAFAHTRRLSARTESGAKTARIAAAHNSDPRTGPAMGPPTMSPRDASASSVTGLTFTNARNQPGIVAVGTNTSLTNVSGNSAVSSRPRRVHPAPSHCDHR